MTHSRISHRLSFSPEDPLMSDMTVVCVYPDDSMSYSSAYHEAAKALATLDGTAMRQYFSEEFEDTWDENDSKSPVEVALEAAGFIDIEVYQDMSYPIVIDIN